MRGKPIYLPGMEMEGQSAKEKVGLPKPSQLKISRAYHFIRFLATQRSLRVAKRLPLPRFRV